MSFFRYFVRGRKKLAWKEIEKASSLFWMRDGKELGLEKKQKRETDNMAGDWSLRRKTSKGPLRTGVFSVCFTLFAFYSNVTLSISLNHSKD